MIAGYILLGYSIHFEVLLIIQLILLVIAISPIGEGILRFIYGLRETKTNKDKEHLFPLFMEVYDTIKENENYTNSKIKIYIDNSMTVNAYAIGRRTIAITKGAMQSLTDNQIKGLFAHEFRSYYAWRHFNPFSINCWKCFHVICIFYNKINSINYGYC